MYTCFVIGPKSSQVMLVNDYKPKQFLLINENIPSVFPSSTKFPYIYTKIINITQRRSSCS